MSDNNDPVGDARKAARKKTRAAHYLRTKNTGRDRTVAFLKNQKKMKSEFIQCAIVCHRMHRNLEVNKIGEVRSLGKIIEPQINYDGYLWLRDLNHKISFHRIVLETFCPKPLPILECDHRNANPACNLLSNLRWVTRRLNQVFVKARGYCVRKNKTFVSYQTKFSKKSYGTFRTPELARARYDEVRNKWIKEERHRIIKLVMARGCTFEEAMKLLNWDERDLKAKHVIS